MNFRNEFIPEAELGGAAREAAEAALRPDHRELLFDIVFTIFSCVSLILGAKRPDKTTIVPLHIKKRKLDGSITEASRGHV